VDAADRRRLDDCRRELHALLKEERLSGATLLVFANKQDLPGALTGDQIRDCLQLDALGLTHHWRIVSCCARTGEHLLTGIDWLIDDIALRLFDAD
jgi:ADP-ribosylation factor-like protein 2